MKKITTTLLVIIACSAVWSCGPKRHGCGPGRCEVKLPQKQMELKETTTKDTDKTFFC
jgi:hypothetical protein